MVSGRGVPEQIESTACRKCAEHIRRVGTRQPLSPAKRPVDDEISRRRASSSCQASFSSRPREPPWLTAPCSSDDDDGPDELKRVMKLRGDRQRLHRRHAARIRGATLTTRGPAQRRPRLLSMRRRSLRPTRRRPTSGVRRQAKAAAPAGLGADRSTWSAQPHSSISAAATPSNSSASAMPRARAPASTGAQRRFASESARAARPSASRSRIGIASS